MIESQQMSGANLPAFACSPKTVPVEFQEGFPEGTQGKEKNMGSVGLFPQQLSKASPELSAQGLRIWLILRQSHLRISLSALLLQRKYRSEAWVRPRILSLSWPNGVFGRDNGVFGMDTPISLLYL